MNNIQNTLENFQQYAETLTPKQRNALLHLLRAVEKYVEDMPTEKRLDIAELLGAEMAC